MKPTDTETRPQSQDLPPLRPGDPIGGRDRELDQVESLMTANRMVLLHGPSGSGKSSLVFAGLCGAMADRLDWVVTLQPQLSDLTKPTAETKHEERKPEREPDTAPTRSSKPSLRKVHGHPREKWPDEILGPWKLLAPYFAVDSDNCYERDSPSRPDRTPGVLVVFDDFERLLNPEYYDSASQISALALLEGIIAKNVLLQGVPRGTAPPSLDIYLIFCVRDSFMGRLERVRHWFPRGLRASVGISFLAPEEAKEAAMVAQCFFDRQKDRQPDDYARVSTAIVKSLITIEADGETIPAVHDSEIPPAVTNSSPTAAADEKSEVTTETGAGHQALATESGFEEQQEVGKIHPGYLRLVCSYAVNDPEFEKNTPAERLEKIRLWLSNYISSAIHDIMVRLGEDASQLTMLERATRLWLEECFCTSSSDVLDSTSSPAFERYARHFPWEPPPNRFELAVRECEKQRLLRRIDIPGPDTYYRLNHRLLNPLIVGSNEERFGEAAASFYSGARYFLLGRRGEVAVAEVLANWKRALVAAVSPKRRFTNLLEHENNYLHVLKKRLLTSAIPLAILVVTALVTAEMSDLRKQLKDLPTMQKQVKRAKDAEEKALQAEARAAKAEEKTTTAEKNTKVAEAKAIEAGKTADAAILRQKSSEQEAINAKTQADIEVNNARKEIEKAVVGSYNNQAASDLALANQSQLDMAQRANALIRLKKLSQHDLPDSPKGRDDLEKSKKNLETAIKASYRSFNFDFSGVNFHKMEQATDQPYTLRRAAPVFSTVGPAMFAFSDGRQTCSIPLEKGKLWINDYFDTERPLRYRSLSTVSENVLLGALNYRDKSIRGLTLGAKTNNGSLLEWNENGGFAPPKEYREFSMTPVAIGTLPGGGFIYAYKNRVFAIDLKNQLSTIALDPELKKIPETFPPATSPGTTVPQDPSPANLPGDLLDLVVANDANTVAAAYVWQKEKEVTKGNKITYYYVGLLAKDNDGLSPATAGHGWQNLGSHKISDDDCRLDLPLEGTSEVAHLYLRGLNASHNGGEAEFLFVATLKSREIRGARLRLKMSDKKVEVMDKWNLRLSADVPGLPDILGAGLEGTKGWVAVSPRNGNIEIASFSKESKDWVSAFRIPLADSEWPVSVAMGDSSKEDCLLVPTAADTLVTIKPLGLFSKTAPPAVPSNAVWEESVGAPLLTDLNGSRDRRTASSPDGRYLSYLDLRKPAINLMLIDCGTDKASLQRIPVPCLPGEFEKLARERYSVGHAYSSGGNHCLVASLVPSEPGKSLLRVSSIPLARAHQDRPIPPPAVETPISKTLDDPELRFSDVAAHETDGKLDEIAVATYSPNQRKTLIYWFKWNGTVWEGAAPAGGTESKRLTASSNDFQVRQFLPYPKTAPPPAPSTPRALLAICDYGSNGRSKLGWLRSGETNPEPDFLIFDTPGSCLGGSISHDGEIFVGGFQGRAVEIWNISNSTSPKQIGAYKHPSGYATAFAFPSENKQPSPKEGQDRPEDRHDILSFGEGPEARMWSAGAAALNAVPVSDPKFTRPVFAATPSVNIQLRCASWARGVQKGGAGFECVTILAFREITQGKAKLLQPYLIRSQVQEWDKSKWPPAPTK